MPINALSRIGGAVIGCFTGCLSGGKKGCGYHMNHTRADIVTPLFALIASVFGCIRFAGKGAYEGGTKGIRAAINYPAVVNEYYYANVTKNEDLTEQLDGLTNDSNTILLSEKELRDFEKYLATVTDLKVHGSLSIQLQNYKSYLEKKCLFSNLTLAKHRNPVILTDDKANQFVCAEHAVKHYMRHCNWEEEPALINTNPITQISRDYPADLKSFVTEVRKRLNVTLAMVTVVGLVGSTANEYKDEPLSPRTIAMVQQMKKEGLWKTAVPFESPANDDVAININDGMSTPLLANRRKSQS